MYFVCHQIWILETFPQLAEISNVDFEVYEPYGPVWRSKSFDKKLEFVKVMEQISKPKQVCSLMTKKRW